MNTAANRRPSPSGVNVQAAFNLLTPEYEQKTREKTFRWCISFWHVTATGPSGPIDTSTSFLLQFNAAQLMLSNTLYVLATTFQSALLHRCHLMTRLLCLSRRVKGSCSASKFPRPCRQLALEFTQKCLILTLVSTSLSLLAGLFKV